MIVSCPECRSEYRVDPDVFAVGGRYVRCGSCACEWYQVGESTPEPSAATEAAEALAKRLRRKAGRTRMTAAEKAALRKDAARTADRAAPTEQPQPAFTASWGEEPMRVDVVSAQKTAHDASARSVDAAVGESSRKHAPAHRRPAEDEPEIPTMKRSVGERAFDGAFEPPQQQMREESVAAAAVAPAPSGDGSSFKDRLELAAKNRARPAVDTIPTATELLNKALTAAGDAANRFRTASFRTKCAAGAAALVAAGLAAFIAAPSAPSDTPKTLLAGFRNTVEAAFSTVGSRVDTAKDDSGMVLVEAWYDLQKRGEDHALVVYGSLANNGLELGVTPTIRIVTRGENGEQLQQWTAKPEKPLLDSGGVSRIYARMMNPDGPIYSVEMRLLAE